MTIHNWVVRLTLCVTLLSMASCNRNSAKKSAEQPSATPIRSENVVKVKTSSIELPAGGTADAIVDITIEDGYHVNANPPTYPFLKATELELSRSNGISTGFIVYPNSFMKQFPFAEKPIAIYEGHTQVKVRLKADAAAKKEATKLAGKLKVQACDDEVCYPPGEIALTIPVNIR